VTWRSIQAAWAREPFFQAVRPAAAETLFVRHIAKLQQAEAEDKKAAAAEVRRLHPMLSLAVADAAAKDAPAGALCTPVIARGGGPTVTRCAQLEFRAMLEGLDPPITGTSQWSAVSNALRDDARVRGVPDERRVAIFEELRDSVRALEDAEASGSGAVATGRGDDGLAVAPSPPRGVAPMQGRLELDLDVLGAAAPEPLAVADEVALLGALRREQVRRRSETAGPDQGGVQQRASKAAVRQSVQRWCWGSAVDLAFSGMSRWNERLL
jgi:hypothetical protein